MRLLMLGRGKTGSLVAESARARGHSVTVLASGDLLSAELVQAHDCAVDFTTPGAVRANLELVLSAGGRMVVGTTGWYAELPHYRQLAEVHAASLVYGTNFSLAVQAFFRAAAVLAAATPHAQFGIREAHHITKLDKPSGTALTLREAVAHAAALAPEQIPIESVREADVPGTHTLTILAPHEQLVLTHEAGSRQAFAEGAVLAAEWLVAQPSPGVWDYAAIAASLKDS